jgi:hypothetical protein
MYRKSGIMPRKVDHSQSVFVHAEGERERESERKEKSMEAHQIDIVGEVRDVKHERINRIVQITAVLFIREDDACSNGVWIYPRDARLMPAHIQVCMREYSYVHSTPR